MKIEIVYLSVGSNINPEDHVPSALETLGRSVEITGASTHYRTTPLGNRSEEADYLNGVWRIETTLDSDDLRSMLFGIERREGRIRESDRYAPRTLDLDLLLWGTLVDEMSGIPDGDVLQRPFLYHPLIELDPELVWPPEGRLLRDLPAPGPLSSMRPDREMTERLRGMIDG